MHDIKLIRKDPDNFSRKIAERNTQFDVKKLLDLDKKNRELIQNKEKLEQEKKIISQKKDKSQFDKSKKLSLSIDDIIEKQSKIKDQIDQILNSLPNLAIDDVPVAKMKAKIKKLIKLEKLLNLILNLFLITI